MVLLTELAQAGPCSLKQPPAPKSASSVSFRDIYDHLELARHQRDAQELESILRSRQVKLKSCGSPFSAPSDASKSKLQASSIKLDDGTTLNIDEQQRDLCDKISERYAIDQVEALLLLRTFLESEDRSLDLLCKPSAPTNNRARSTLGLAASTRAKSSKVASHDLVSDFLDAFNVFYFEERLYILRCVCSLFRIAEDEAHELFQLASDILALFADEAFGTQCLSRFETMTTDRLIDSIRVQPRYSTFWAKQNLKEQSGLLEVIFLLFYGRVQASPTFVVRLLQTLQATDVGRQQSNVGFFDRESSELVICIGHLLVLIGVESLALEEIMDGIDLSKPGQGRLADEPARLSEALDLLEQTGQDGSRSPILLAWALVFNRLDDALSNVQDQLEVETVADLPPHLVDLIETLKTGDSGPPIWRRLAHGAFTPDMSLFQVMFSMLSSPLLASSNSTAALAVSAASALAYRAVFKGLLLSVTELVKPEFLPDFDGLVSLWEAAFGSGVAAELSPAAIEGVAALCLQFWEIDSHFDSRCATIDTARRRWPVSFRPLIRLMKALTGNSKVEALDSWPSSLHPGATSPVIEQACGSDFRFLGRIPTFAQVLPHGAGTIGAPFETLEGGDYTSITYRVTRPTRVAGTHVELAAGTIGSTISELGSTPVIVLWNPTRPISAWKVMRDILASFPPYLSASNSSNPAFGGNDAAVFDDVQTLADFTKLAPANADDAWEDVAAEMLELFSSVLSASSKLAWSVLAHLDGNDAALMDDSMDEDVQDRLKEGHRGSSKDLASISINLLQHALVGSPINTRLVDAAYKLLSILLPYLPNEIWQTIRSSNVLFGSAGSLSYMSSRSGRGVGLQQGSGLSASMLLAHEVSRASYEGLLSLLDFLTALVFELQRSHFVSAAELLEVKATVLTRALGWVFESVWPEFHNWRYSKLREKLEIGRRCTLLFELVLAETSWKVSNLPSPSDGAEARGPAAKLVDAMEQALVTHANTLYIAPLITALGSGQQLIDQLHRAGRQADAALAEDFVLASLRLARLIISRRRDLSKPLVAASLAGETTEQRGPAGARVDMGLLENLFFDHATVATRSVSGGGHKSARIELASAVMGFVLLPISSSLSSEAAKLITAVCRSTAEITSLGYQAPGLVSHLGTISELESTMEGLVNVVGNTHQDATLRADVWTMLSAIVDTQPALATLLLTGRHLAKTTEFRLTESQDPNGKADDAGVPIMSSSYGQALKRTALDVASESVQIWKELLDSNPGLLESILRFLDVAWVHASEHVAAFQPLRAQSIFFTALGDLVSDSLGKSPGLPEGFVDEEGGRRTDAHEEVREYCHRAMSQARALRLLERDIQLSPVEASDAAKGSKSKQTSFSLKTLFSIITDAGKLKAAIGDCFRMHCDPGLQYEAERRLAEVFPTVNLAALRHPPRRDDFDFRRQYGDDYIYDSISLRRKLEGFYETLGDEDTADLATLEEGVMVVATINLDWSTIDVQATCVRAWTQALQTTMGRLVSEASNANKMDLLEEACMSAWVECATIATEEEREGDVMRGIHATRIDLLSHLMETAWGTTPRSGIKAKSEDVVKASELTGRLLSHTLFSVEDSIKGLASPAFHRGCFAMVIFCSLKARQLIQQLNQEKDQATKHGDVHRSLHRVTDNFCQHTIRALGSTLKNCVRCIQKSHSHTNIARQYEDDLDLLVSIFELVVRSDMGLLPHNWLSQVQQASLFQTSIDLLSRAPVLRFDSSREGAPTNSANHPLYVMSILSFLLAISAHPASGEQLALEGVVNGLTSNMLSESLEAGEVSPLLLSGDRNPMHECWTMMLRIIVNLIDNLGGCSQLGHWSGASARFIETDVEGFVRVYGKQMEKALDLAPIQALSSREGRDFGRSSAVGQAAASGTGLVDVLSMAGLEELELISRLYHSMARAERDTNGASALAADVSPSELNHRRSISGYFSQKAVWLLQPLVHLLQHPRELSSLLGLDTYMEEDSSKDDGKAKAMRLEDEAMGKMRTIVSMLGAALWHQTKSAVVLCREPQVWPSTSSGCALIRPTMRTGIATTASLGTLLDLTSYMTDYLGTSGLDKKELESGVQLLEETLGMAATQAAMWANGRSDRRSGPDNGTVDGEKKPALPTEEEKILAKLEESARQELEVGFSRDLLSAIRSAESVVSKVEPKDGQKSVSLLVIIAHFVESRLSRR